MSNCFNSLETYPQNRVTDEPNTTIPLLVTMDQNRLDGIIMHDKSSFSGPSYKRLIIFENYFDVLNHRERKINK